MQNLLSTLVAAAFVAAFATGQAADIKITGTACTSPEGTAKISVTSPPKLGRDFAIEYAGPNHQFDSATQTESHPILVMGFNQLGVFIPSSLLPGQPVGCALTVEHDVVLPSARATCGGCDDFEAAAKFLVPSDASLIGLQFMAQWLVVNTRCNGGTCTTNWVQTSDTLVATIGN